MDLTKLAETYFAEVQTPVSVMPVSTRSPVHVVYGGANLFKAETPVKLGAIAQNSLNSYAPNFAEFARALWLKGADRLPQYDELIAELEFEMIEHPARLKAENYDAWYALMIYQRVLAKLASEPVEDFRIDFEDGYGFRPDDEEDADAVRAAGELARAMSEGKITPFCGFRIKSFGPETRRRAVSTLDIFLSSLIEKTGGTLPANFVVTLPKITSSNEVAVLARLLDAFEKENSLENGSIGIEVMVETPEALFGNGRLALPEIVKAANGRCTSAHFGAYDFTSSFGIVAEHQHLHHDSCNFARQLMQVSLTPLGIRLSDSVTTEMPIPVHRGDGLSEQQQKENAHAVHKAWRLHFNNVTTSMIDGFYQSWDLHPAQLIPRYAAVNAFFLDSFESSALRLRGFMDQATKAMVTGNQFDDAASAQGLLNFFIRARSCGALTDDEIVAETGLTIDEIQTGSFSQIMARRHSKVS
jgi:citrate lyase beta subunit